MRPQAQPEAHLGMLGQGPVQAGHVGAGVQGHSHPPQQGGAFLQHIQRLLQVPVQLHGQAQGQGGSRPALCVGKPSKMAGWADCLHTGSQACFGLQPQLHWVLLQGCLMFGAA